MDPFNLDDRAVIDPVAEPPGCAQCRADRDAVVDLEPARAWRPGVVVDVWRCPECGHEVVRGGADNEEFL